MVRKAAVIDIENFKQTNQVLSTYNGGKIKPIGKCGLPVRNPRNGKKYNKEFVVVENAATSILGARTSQEMKLIHMHGENIQIAQIHHTEDKIPELTRRDIEGKYESVHREK